MPDPQPRDQGFHEAYNTTTRSEVPRGQRLDPLTRPIHRDVPIPPSSLHTAGSKMRAVPTGKGTRQSTPDIYGICLSK